MSAFSFSRDYPGKLPESLLGGDPTSPRNGPGGVVALADRLGRAGAGVGAAIALTGGFEVTPELSITG